MFAITIIGIGFYVYLVSKRDDTEYNFLLVSLWIIWTLLLFMPAMRQRYTYLVDILLIIICFFNKKLIPSAIMEIVISLITYCVFLFDMPEISILYSFLNVVSYAYLTKDFFKEYTDL